MPELPEVETIARRLAPELEGRRIHSFVSHWPRQVLPGLTQATRAMTDRRVLSVSRRGKLLVWTLAPAGFVLVHLRMSGRFEWGEPDRADPPHVRAVWTLDTGRRLLFCDARKFGRIRYADDLAQATAQLGPEPLDSAFTSQHLGDMLAARARHLKPLLLDQSFLAGLGNIYTDEALFRAGLHPLTRSDQLSPDAVRRLHRAIRSVLRTGIQHNGTSLDWIYPGGQMQDFLRVYGRTGQPCPVCATPIRRLVVGQRATHICEHCQIAR